ncbi:MAG: peptidase M13, partial [Deltaproteobacteria bacterium]|nr:peptidase M13 [Deltaproteobacteria bacterium]
MKNINLCCFLLILLSTPYTLASAASTKSGIDQSFIDTSVRPQDDFFRYVNGKWLKEFVIPADKSNYGSFTKLIDESEKHIHTIIRDAQQAKAEMGSDKQRIGDLFQSFMDNKTIEKKGITPLKNEFARIDAIQDLKTLSAYIAHAQILTTAPFNIYVQVDEKNPNQYITYLYQAGLGLPDREYYLQQDQKSLDIKEAYLTHIEKMLTLAGVTHVKTASARIFAIESALAKIQWSKEQRRDSIKTYNLTSTKALQKQLSNLDWETWVNASGLNNIKHIVVSVPSYVIALNGLFQSIGIDDWKIYFRWKLISTAAPYLSSAFVKENFAFYQTILAGVPENQPRWKRGVLLVNYTFGELVGKIYVEKHFSEDAKKYMQDMVENLRQAYQKSMHELTWMTPKTKNKALQKLAKFTPKIGYPDKFRDYAGLAITKDDLYGNIVAISQYESKYNLDKLGKK